MTLPTTQRSVIIAQMGKAVVTKDATIPALRDDYVLVKVTAVALNPTDWKHVDSAGQPGARVGCDYAGVVQAVGGKLTRDFKVGDRIAGLVHGANSNNKDDGAFAEYIVAKTGVALHIPDDVSDEDAATLGVGVATVGQGLFQSLKLPLPDSSTTSKATGTILIYGGSTATGTLAIQYAKLAGWTVVTTCSPRNFDLVTKLGADKAFDYNAADVGAQIRAYTNDNLAHAFDCISVESSAKICSDALSTHGGKYSSLLQVKAPRTDVESDMTLAYTGLGEAFSKFGNDFPAMPAQYEFQVRFWALAEQLLKEKKIKSHSAEVGADGLEGVLKGLDLMRNDKVSGKKLVYRVAETPK